jgi:protein translocase SEC61 complex gamma subunit
MGGFGSITGFFKGLWGTLKLARKSDFEEFKLYLKITLIGIGIFALIGFGIKLLATAIPGI